MVVKAMRGSKKMSKKSGRSPKLSASVSLHPLDFESAVRAAMATGKPPKAPPSRKPVCGTCHDTGIFKGKPCPDCASAYVEGKPTKPRLDKPQRGKK